MSIAEILVYLDEQRGRFLKERAKFAKGSEDYKKYSTFLTCLNKMKKEVQHLSDSDQIPLGL